MNRLAYFGFPMLAAAMMGGCSFATKIPGVKKIPGIKKIPGMEEAVEGEKEKPAPNGLSYGSDRALEVGDVLDVAVYKGLRSSDEIFEDEVTVAADGTVEIGDFGNPKVAGLKVERAVDVIGSEFLRSARTSAARLSVHVRSVNGTRIIRVEGGVGRPGTYLLGGGMTVKAAIAQAGGKKRGAGQDFVYVSSRGVRKTLVLDGMGGGDPEGAWVLKAGDVVDVPVGY